MAAALSASESKLATLYKESKIAKSNFKALLDAKEPRASPAQIDFARKELRNIFLKMLFHFPFSARTRGIEMTLWSETTHPLVHWYRGHLSALEARMKKVKEGKGDESQDGPAHYSKKKGMQQLQGQLASSYLREASTFRDFLQVEENFWRDLAGRIARLFDLHEVHRHLVALDIATTAEQINYMHSSSTGMERIVDVEKADTNLMQQAQLPMNKQRLIELIHKSFIYCGDLARYQEMYRSEIVDDRKSSPKRGGRGGSRGRPGRDMKLEIANPKRDFAKASLCYEEACHLIPSNGNPWNQLAVLASYEDDIFSSIRHYYRALCVHEPFDRAKQNLEKTLTKTLSIWTEQGGLNTASSKHEPKTAKTLQELAVLHAAFFLRKKLVILSYYPGQCLSHIKSLLLRKALRTEHVVWILDTAIAALWMRRLNRGNSPIHDKETVASSVMVEQQILVHLCGYVRELFDVSASEISIALQSHETMSVRLADNLTPLLRRLLPGVRFASKWLKGHIDYVQRMRDTGLLKDSGSKSKGDGALMSPSLPEEIDRMWSVYIRFINLLRYAFPFDSLPSIGASAGQSGMSSLHFEEDQEMRGFLPLLKSMNVDEHSRSWANDSFPAMSPTEEHLLRITDVLIDAKVLAQTAASPINYDDEHRCFDFQKSMQQNSSSPETRSVIDVDDVPSESGKVSGPFKSNEWQRDDEASEDAVDLAMRAVDERRHALNVENADKDNSFEDDDEEEIILIPSRNPASSISKQSSPIKPAAHSVWSHPHAGHGNIHRLPSKGEEYAAPVPTPAQSLLDVLNGSSRKRDNSPVPHGRVAQEMHATPNRGPGLHSYGVDWGLPALKDTHTPAQALHRLPQQSDIWAPPSHLQSHAPFGQLPAWPPATSANDQAWPKQQPEAQQRYPPQW